MLYGKNDQIYDTSRGSYDEKRNYVVCLVFKYSHRKLAELHDTERNYVKLLQMLINVFMKTLSSNPKVVSKV